MNAPLNDAIARAAWKAARGEITVPGSPGNCLAVVRLIIEAALWGGREEFYRRYLVARTSRGHETRTDWVPYAADIEASMKLLRYAVPFEERRAGDLIFNHRLAAPVGHVGLLLDRSSVLENTTPKNRPHSLLLGRSLCLTPVEHFETTLVARLQPREVR
jgi:hypothetical protein